MAIVQRDYRFKELWEVHFGLVVYQGRRCDCAHIWPHVTPSLYARWAELIKNRDANGKQYALQGG